MYLCVCIVLIFKCNLILFFFKHRYMCIFMCTFAKMCIQFLTFVGVRRCGESACVRSLVLDEGTDGASVLWQFGLAAY